MMKPFDIFISYIAWGTGGKARPVMMYASSAEYVIIYPITTQYVNKSEAIKAKYFKINDWMQAGLDKQSYIDTGTSFKQLASLYNNVKPIGRLTETDKKRLLEFLKHI